VQQQQQPHSRSMTSLRWRPRCVLQKLLQQMQRQQQRWQQLEVPWLGRGAAVSGRILKPCSGA
jgi:hypothetical protein